MPRIQLTGKTRWEIMRVNTSLAADSTIALMLPDDCEGVLIHIKTANVSTFSMTPAITTTTKNGDTLTLWTAAAAITANASSTYHLYEQESTGLNGVTDTVMAVLPREFNLFLNHATGSADVMVELCYL